MTIKQNLKSSVESTLGGFSFYSVAYTEIEMIFCQTCSWVKHGIEEHFQGSLLSRSTWLRSVMQIT